MKVYELRFSFVSFLFFSFLKSIHSFSFTVRGSGAGSCFWHGARLLCCLCHPYYAILSTRTYTWGLPMSALTSSLGAWYHTAANLNTAITLCPYVFVYPHPFLTNNNWITHGPPGRSMYFQNLAGHPVHSSHFINQSHWTNECCGVTARTWGCHLSPGPGHSHMISVMPPTSWSLFSAILISSPWEKWAWVTLCFLPFVFLTAMSHHCSGKSWRRIW